MGAVFPDPAAQGLLLVACSVGGGVGTLTSSQIVPAPAHLPTHLQCAALDLTLSARPVLSRCADPRATPDPTHCAGVSSALLPWR